MIGRKLQPSQTLSSHLSPKLIPRKPNSRSPEMDSQGQRNSPNPSSMLTALLSKRAKLVEEQRSIEKQVYDMETAYLQDSNQCGNVLKGFEGYLSSSKSTALLKRSRKFQLEDRLFSLSSITSQAAEEQALGREDGRLESGPGRYKGGVVGSTQGKPKKGRAGAREGKRIRQADQDYDYEEDPDMM